MKTALVTTLRNAQATLDYFVAYHLSAGFDHLFLFFDDPDDPGFEQYRYHPAITAVRHDALLRRQWLNTRAAFENYAFADREVMARQIMNAGLALQMALRKGIDWLLHIDADELFHTPTESVNEHFAGLSRQGIQVASYLNHEAIPERTSIQNFFIEVSLFKKNRGLFTHQQTDWFRSQFNTHIPYFHFYSNGKAAAVVSQTTHPLGVHAFEADREPVLLTNGPVILHFPCCGFEHFLAKYRTLGRFGDKWFNRGEAIDQVAPTHSWSRDVVQTQNEDRIRDFYNEVFIDRFEHLKAKCLEEGIFVRIALPKLDQFVGSLRTETDYLL